MNECSFIIEKIMNICMYECSFIIEENAQACMNIHVDVHPIPKGINTYMHAHT